MQPGDRRPEREAGESFVVKPRLFSRCGKGNDRLGKEAVELAARAGLELDEWQAFVLQESLRGTAEKWDALEIGLVVPRQNGKGSIIEARILAEMYLLKSPLTIYSAHNFDTAFEHFRRIEFLIEECPELAREIKGVKGGRQYGVTLGHGKEGIELTGDRRLRFRTRTKGGGRGFGCNLLILDEAMFLPEWTHGALMPVISAKTQEENPQIWYTGSAVDQTVHEHGVVFSRVRERGVAGDDPGLTFFEWSVEHRDQEGVDLPPDSVPADVVEDQAAWAQANPALGIRISPDYIDRTERRSMSLRNFSVERLGVGDWPRTDHVTSVIDIDAFDALVDETSVLQNPVCLAYDVSPDRQTSISAAGLNADGKWHVEVIESRRGTGWVADRFVELIEQHHPAAVGCDGFGPAGSLVPELEDKGIMVETFDSTEYGRACGQFVDAIDEKAMRHLGSAELTAAVRLAATRPLGDAWVWSRKNSSGNISPLVSVTLALSKAKEHASLSVFVIA